MDVLRENHYDVKLSVPEFVKLVTWIDTNGQYYGSYFGHRNVRYKGLANFRPHPTLESACGTRPGLERRACPGGVGGERPADIIVVILTDGMENASREWTRAQVFELITEAENAGWQFIFLGANQDSWEVSQNLGIRRGAVVDWSPDARSHAHAIEEASSATCDFRTHGLPLSYYRDRRES